MPRSDKTLKMVRERSAGARTRAPQTFSAQKGSVSKFGVQKSSVAPDDPRGMISMYCASRSRKNKITLVKMPWEDQK